VDILQGTGAANSPAVGSNPSRARWSIKDRTKNMGYNETIRLKSSVTASRLQSETLRTLIGSILMVSVFLFVKKGNMKHDEEDWTALTKKFAVCDTESWDETRLYWNAEITGWVNLHNERTPPTLFSTEREAKFAAVLLSAHVAIIWTDQ
jgi:hypothetical protein